MAVTLSPSGLTLGSTTVDDWNNAGVWNLIESVDFSSSVSSVDFTTGIDSTYDTYMLIGSGMHTNNAATDACIQGYINGAWQTSGYRVIGQRIRWTGSSSVQDTGTFTDCLSTSYLYPKGASDEGVDFKIIFSNPASTSYHAQAMGEWWGEDNASNVLYNNCCGVYQSGTQAMTGVRLRIRNGVTFNGHKVALYGLKY